MSEVGSEIQQSRNAPAFWWRLALAVVSGAIWASWFWLANKGQPFQVLPSEEDIVTLRHAMAWIWWAKIGIISTILVGTALVFVLTKRLRNNAAAWTSLAFFWFWSDFLADVLGNIFLGWFLLPWGLNLTLSAILLPVLGLARPYRNWGISIAVALVDFSLLRMIYVSAVISAYYNMLRDPAFPETSFTWLWVVALTVAWAAWTLVVVYFYGLFVVRSIRSYDPFAVQKPI